MVGFSKLVFGDKGQMPLTRFKDLHLGVVESFPHSLSEDYRGSAG